MSKTVTTRGVKYTYPCTSLNVWIKDSIFNDLSEVARLNQLKIPKVVISAIEREIKRMRRIQKSQKKIT